MPITTYLPTRVHVNAAGAAIANSAGRLVRGWSNTNLCAAIATKRFRIVDYTDGDIEIPAGANCKTSTDTVWDGTFPYKNPGGYQWQAAASGYVRVSGYQMYAASLFVALVGENEGAGWPAALPALTGLATTAAMRLQMICANWGGLGYCWFGTRAQRQVIAGVDQWCATAAGTYTRFDGYTNAPAQLEVEEY